MLILYNVFYNKFNFTYFLVSNVYKIWLPFNFCLLSGAVQLLSIIQNKLFCTYGQIVGPRDSLVRTSYIQLH